MDKEELASCIELEGKNIAYIRRWVKPESMYTQLAEECIELAKEALKMQRESRKTEPDILAIKDRQRKLIEEFTDVVVCSKVIGFSIDKDTYYYKLNRWAERVSMGDYE